MGSSCINNTEYLIVLFKLIKQDAFSYVAHGKHDHCCVIWIVVGHANSDVGVDLLSFWIDDREDQCEQSFSADMLNDLSQTVLWLDQMS